MPNQVLGQHRIQQLRMGNSNLIQQQQGQPQPMQSGKQPPRMLLQQIQATRINGIGGQQQQQVSSHQQPLQAPVMQVQAPPPYPGPPPPYPGNNAPPSSNDQVCTTYNV